MNYFYALITNENNKFILRKLCFDLKKGPYYSIPKEYWDLEKHHPILFEQIKQLKVMPKMKRSLKIKIYESESSKVIIKK